MAMETALWVAAQDLARQAGMEFTVPCAHNVRDFIRAGILNMRRLSRETEEDWELARTNLIRLVKRMVEVTAAVKEGASGGKGIPIREGALVVAKRLCPLWPYC